MARILIVEDDDIMAAFLSELLTKAGYGVRAVSDGEAGTKAADAEKFDLVITDLVMPEKEGIQVLQEVKARHSIPVIAISGGGRISPKLYLDMAKNLGADYTFEKPFESSVLLAAVRECLSD